MHPLVPTPKVAAGGAIGVITAFIMFELSHRFNVTLAPEESSFLTFFLMFVASYFAPRSAPTPEQIAQIKAQP